MGRSGFGVGVDVGAAASASFTPPPARFQTLTAVVKGKEVDVALVGRRGTQRIGGREWGGGSRLACLLCICTSAANQPPLAVPRYPHVASGGGWRGWGGEFRGV